MLANCSGHCMVDISPRYPVSWVRPRSLAVERGRAPDSVQEDLDVSGYIYDFLSKIPILHQRASNLDKNGALTRTRKGFVDLSRCKRFCPSVFVRTRYNLFPRSPQTRHCRKAVHLTSTVIEQVGKHCSGDESGYDAQLAMIRVSA